MQFVFEALKRARVNMLKVVENTPKDKLGQTASPYNNNVLWNAAHCIATVDLLCYGLTGNEKRMNATFIDQFRKGTSAQSFSENEVESILALLRAHLVQQIEQLEADYKGALLQKEITPYETSFGVTIASIEEVIQFMLVHEGMHFGYILSQKRSITA